MKKFLLMAALAAGSLTASADNTDYFKVYYEGEEVKSGSEIVCNKINFDGSAYGMGYIFKCDISVVSQKEEAQNIFGILTFLDQPTYDEYLNQGGVPGMECTWGKPSLCYAGGGTSGKDGNCFSPTEGNGGVANVILPGSHLNSFTWSADLNQQAPASVTKLLLTNIILDEDGNEIEDSEYTVTILFGKNAVTGVEGVEADENAAPEYYTLTGVRVENPNKGIYIVKRGNKVTKEVVR